ncbi:MAG: D-amino-acid transaminase [Bacillota bacterium]
MKNLAWINGEVCNLEEAKVPVEDRGFLFGDGVYEVIKIYNGKPFYLESHLERLQRSAEAISIPLSYSLAELRKHIAGLVEKSECEYGYLYMQVTRGCAPRGHLFPNDPAPTVLIYVRAFESNSSKDLAEPADCITLPDERWMNCYIKTVNLLPNILALQKAYEAGAAEAILYRPDGTVTEGTRTNIFAVIDGIVRTHPATRYILPGITRQIVLDLFERISVPVKEEAFKVSDLQNASEVWTASTGLEIFPVGTIDGKPLKEKPPGPVCKRLVEEFRKVVEAECYGGDH